MKLTLDRPYTEYLNAQATERMRPRAWPVIAELAGFTNWQQQAVEQATRYRYPLLGGTRGPGKSYICRWWLLGKLLEFAKAGLRNVRVGLFCEDYPVLRDRQISKIAAEFPRSMGRIRSSEEQGLGFHLTDEYGGGVLLLRNLDEAGKYVGAEFACIAVDQLERNPLSTFNVLRGSLRWPGVERPQFLSTSHPGDPDGGAIGLAWVKQYWIDRDFPVELQPYADEFGYIKGTPTDNPHLSSDYWTMLESQPPDIRRAWLDGDWDVFPGQVFKVRREIHGFEGAPPAGWTFICADYGEVAPAAAYWVRVDGEGNLWLYRELYRAGLTYLDFKREVRRLSVDSEGNPEQIRYVKISPDIWGTSKGTGVRGSEILANREHGGFSLPIERADNNRIEGWRVMRMWIDPATRPMVYVSTTHCPNWWRTVPMLVYDTARIEDVHPDCEDHAGEATRYGLMSRPRPIVTDAAPDRPLRVPWDEEREERWAYAQDDMK